MEFYGAWQEIAMHHKLNGKSQSVTAELGYLGFQDSLKKICSSVISKLREAMPPVTSHVATL